MFLAAKTACAGIVFVLLSGISATRPAPPVWAPNHPREVAGAGHRNDVRKIQQTLRDQGHYRGKVDGVFGLRTRASIRDYQKAENLPVTGGLDAHTATKLGVPPEIHEEIDYETTQGKPSAGITWAEGSRRTGRRLRKAVRKAAASEPGPGHREKTLQAESGNPPQ